MNDERKPKMGPLESRINDLWTEVWKSECEGDVYEAHLAMAESEITNLIANFPQNNADLNDLNRAKVHHVYQSKFFAVHLDGLSKAREVVKWGLNLTAEQANDMNQHALRSMTLAQGAVALAVLAFIGNDKDALATNAPIWIIGLCGAGFLLTILGSHVGVAIATKTFTPFLELSYTRVSAENRDEKMKRMVRYSKLMSWSTRPFYYASFLCLVAATIFGIVMLTHQRVPDRQAYISYPHGGLR